MTKTRIKRTKTIQKRPEGRPTKLTPDVIVKYNEYISSCGREQTKLPTIEGLALYLNVNRDTIYEWKKVNKEFSDTIDRLQMLQKDQLINDGICGGRDVNSQIVSLLLKANHGIRENEPSTLIQVNIKPILGELEPK